MQAVAAFLFVIVFYGQQPFECQCAAIEDLIGEHVQLKYQVVTNVEKDGELVARLTFTNNAQQDILDDKWTIHFSHMHRIIGAVGKRANELEIKHVNGWMHTLKPVKGSFKGFLRNTPYEFDFASANWEISKTDILPNWYVVGSNDANVRIIKSTEGESLSFVGHFNTSAQYKRVRSDKFSPWSTESRYDRLISGYKGPNAIPSSKEISEAEHYRIIPQPKSIECEKGNSNVKFTKEWILYKPLSTNNLLINDEIDFLRNHLGIVHRKESGTPPSTPYIHIYQKGSGAEQYNYTSHFKDQVPHISISYTSKSGLLYGFVSLWSLVQQAQEKNQSLPSCIINDEPRYPYRGFMLDISRNFQNKSYISKLLQNMALVKLNVLHLHLVDDEGWRIEIPGFPELTEIGSQRCHDLTRRKCLMPHLGSCPTGQCSKRGPGSGYISVAEYKELLLEANKLNIEIIPEIDMPGHSHAAIIAMEEYERRTGSNAYRISDPNDTSTYISVQQFKDNAINPCLQSTYNFVDKVVKEIKKMHEETGIPLKIFHFGGDETPNGAWVNSPACQKYHSVNSKSNIGIRKRRNTMTYDDINRSELMKNFVERVSSIIKNNNLVMAGWEDGFFGAHEQVYNRSSLPTKEVYAYAWNNIWEWGAGPRAYKLANAGYKTILAPGTHVYLDHPQEPDSEERGLYWATRFTDTERVFGYVATDIYRNIEYSRLGDLLNKSVICPNLITCPKLNRPENIIGLQAELWSEVDRTENQVDEMIWPRLAAVAERAWKVAAWELQENKDSQLKDYKSFAKTLSDYLLPYWDKSIHGPSYYLPPVGAKIINKRLLASSAFPGLNIEYKVNNNKWMVYPTKIGVDVSNEKGTIYLRTKSFSANPRYGRVVALNL